MQHLIAEVRLLHERLHRVTVGLALTEELLAEIFERMAAVGDSDALRFRRQANRARIAAEECRAFASRLDELDPDGNPQAPLWDNPFPQDEIDRPR